MGANGIQIDASGAGAVSVTNEAAIHAGDGRFDDGILVDRTTAGSTMAATTIDNRGDITTSGFGIRVRYVTPNAATQTGDVTVANSGAITVTGIRAGIDLAQEFNPYGDLRLTNSGAITAESGTGINVAFAPGNTASTGDVRVDNSGAIKANGPGIHLNNAGRGRVTLTNEGNISSATSEAINVVASERSGAVSVTNRGDLSAAGTTGGDIVIGRDGLQVSTAGAHGVSVTNDGGTITSMEGKGVYLFKSGGAGDARFTQTGGESKITAAAAEAGIHLLNTSAGNVDVDVKGGEIRGRKGVHVQTVHSDPKTIDVEWSGRFTDRTTTGAATNDDDRIRVRDLNILINADREVQAERTARYGSAAGIEVQVIRWAGTVDTLVASGDDPDGLADDAARAMVFDTGSSDPALKARSDALVAQFRAAIENDDIVALGGGTVTGALNSIDSNNDGEYSDDEIATHLNANRGLLRNVMRWGLSEAEKAVLAAVATNTGLDAALGDAEAGFSGSYKTAVKALFDRHNAGNIKIDVTGGSIDSRGDGVRAYYTTHHADNGAIRVTVAEGASVTVAEGASVTVAEGASVTVAEGASVTGGMAGIYVANAGLDAGEDGTADDILKQSVTVHGMVTGGTDAAVHLVGGGRLTVGATGKVHAGSSGRAILVNEPGRAVIRIDGEVKGGAGAPAAVHLTGGGSVTVGGTGRVEANGAQYGIRGDNAPTRVAVLQASLFAAGGEGELSREGVDDAVDRLGTVGGDGIREGFREGDAADKVPVAIEETNLDGRRTGYYLPLDLVGGEPTTEGNDAYANLPPCRAGYVPGDDGECAPPTPERTPERTPEPPPLPFSCEGIERCRLYEALPSVLLAMNGLPTWAERSSASRDAQGGWARMEAASGRWQADTSTRPNVAYDHRRYGVRAGVDLMAGGESAPLGLGMSIHGLRGSAEMSPVGEVDLSGAGVGVHATTFAGGLHVDVQAAMTRYDVDLKSTVNGALNSGVKGQGFAVAVEAGKRMGMERGMFLTPRVGLMWSKVALDDFTDSVGSGGARVSVGDAESMKGRAGAGVEKVLAGVAGMDSRLFGSLDVEQEFSKETDVKVSDTALRTSASPTRLHLAVGGDHRWGAGRYALRGSLNYAAGGDGNRDYGAGLDFTFRF